VPAETSKPGNVVGRNKRSVLLIHPPYGDFTYPYHSLSYVATPLKAAGYNVDVIDLNALWFRSVFDKSRIKKWHEELRSEFLTLDEQNSLDIAQQKRVAEVLQCLAICNNLNPGRAVKVFRSEAFYDFDKYLWARSQVRAFEKLLNHLYPHYDFFSSFAVPPYVATAKEAVDRARSLASMSDDFTRILRERCKYSSYLFCGVSFPFSAHLIPGMAVFPALAKLFPGAPLVAGGTAISDIHKYKSENAALLPFAELCDFFYVGEAETAVVEFADWCRGETSAMPAQVLDLHNLESQPAVDFSYVSLSRKSNKSFYRYSWAEQPPDYSWIDWGLYLAPENRVNYSPARGCFWNRCTFCDYGLNTDGPTAPSRVTEADIVVAHLKLLAAQNIKHVYLAVDAISPSFLNAFADCVLAEKLDIQWSTQFFITRQFTTDLIRKLEASGLRAASFGLESGSSRVLECMGKGANRVEDVLRPAFASFTATRVGLQPLFFFGFPGETDDDRQQTVDLLRENEEIFSTISKGGLFDLLPGSIIARSPEQFGVSQVCRRPGDDIAGALEYEVRSHEESPTCKAFRHFNDQLPHWSVYERPWAGGVDTFHTQLYVERFGRNIFRKLHATHEEQAEPWARVVIATRFNLEEIMENVVLHHGIQSLNQMKVDGQSARMATTAASANLFAPIPGERSRQDFELRLRQYREI
jgi:anaerobic magnesium-protoporphyrin IX monomethyl ester cyclase